MTHAHHYRRLLIMVALSFAAMYVLMYAMVDAFRNVVPNLNQAYMAALMTAPMAIIELALMRGMYRNRRLNLAIVGASVLVLAGSWFAIREQTAIGDVQMLKSMIPHHAGAVLMCGEARLSDPEAKTLCQSIIESQQAEIAQMRSMLARLE